jgi:hypothetical protein
VKRATSDTAKESSLGTAGTTPAISTSRSRSVTASPTRPSPIRMPRRRSHPPATLPSR